MPRIIDVDEISWTETAEAGPTRWVTEGPHDQLVAVAYDLANQCWVLRMSDDPGEPVPLDASDPGDPTAALREAITAVLIRDEIRYVADEARAA